MSSTADTSEQELCREAIIKLLQNTEWPLATTEVAEEFDETQQNTHYYLTQLVEDGRVEKRVVGGTAIWRLPN